MSESYPTLSFIIADKSIFLHVHHAPRDKFFRCSILFIPRAPKVFFSRVRLNVSLSAADRQIFGGRPKSRPARLDRNRKLHMNSLCHPGYSFYVLCTKEDCIAFPITYPGECLRGSWTPLFSLSVLCHKTEFWNVNAAAAQFPTPETRGRLGTIFRRNEFCDRLGGQALLIIKQLHDDDIWLQLPEFILVFLCYLNLSIPLKIKEQ